MKLLDNLSLSEVKRLGLRRLRKEIHPGSSYTLVKEPGKGRLLLVESGVYSAIKDSTEDFFVVDKEFLQTPDGLFRIISEDSAGWLIETDSSPKTVLKPAKLYDPLKEDPVEVNLKPLYSIGSWMAADSDLLRRPPYPSMNQATWLKALDMSDRVKGRVNTAAVLRNYRKLKR